MNTGARIRVAACGKTFADGTRALAPLDLDVEAHKSLLKSIFSWMASLPKAADDLAGGMDEARKLGFEAAGANPKAKTELIESLKGFAQAINAGNPAVKKKSD